MKPRYIMKKLLAASLALIMSACLFADTGFKGEKNGGAVISVSADETDENAELDRQLKELEKKKKELDEKIAAADSDINGKQEKLDAVNEKALVIQKKIKKTAEKSLALEDEMCELDDKMRATRYELEQSEEDIKKGIEEFKGRLRAMYIAGNDSYSEVLINAESFYDILMRAELVKRVAQHDNELIDSLLAEKAKIEKYQSDLEKQSESLKEKSAEYAAQQKSLAEEQSQLLKLKQEYGDSIDALKGDMSGYLDELDLLSDEYDKVSQAAQTTTTPAPTTTEPQTEPPDDDSSETKKTTTTKKDSSSPDSSEEKTTTTKKTTTQPPETTEPETQPPTTTAPTTTTPKKTTTKQTTTPAPDPDPEPPVSDRDEKISIVVNYAKSMVGGRYVWGGNQFAATDCSGLVMLSYAQIGISLPHLASAQAGYGTSVSRSELQPGDLVFFGGSTYSSIYHVAMYIGDGKVVHAESTATGIVISYLDSVAKYNNITCMKRLI
ncbi:MAG: NlpC/P60 family protein [Oscillospiraceae bacterium]